MHGSRIPADQDQRSALLRTELAGKRVLVLLDNVQSSEHVRPLIPGGESLLLVTSRSQLRSLATREGLRRVSVAEMSKTDAVDLLSGRLLAAFGNPGPSAVLDPDDLAELADLCGRLPVALAVAAERVGRDIRRPLSTLIAQLRDSRERLDALTAWRDDPMTDVRAVFDWSYRILDEETAGMFRLLGLHCESFVSVSAAAALAGVDEVRAERLLDRLTDCHLLGEGRPGWYQIHDLVRGYASDVVREVDPEPERVAAVSRLRSWCVHSALNARRVLSPPLLGLPVGDPVPGVVPQVFADGSEAFQWFADHLHNLAALATEAAEGGDHRTAYTLTPLLSIYLTMIAASQEAISLYEQAESSALSAGDLVAQAQCANLQGGVRVRIGQYDERVRCHARARELYARAGNAVGELSVSINMGILLVRTGRFEEAIALYEQILGDARRLELPRHEALILNNLSVSYVSGERFEDAVGAAEQSVSLNRVGDDPHRLAGALDTLGEAQVAMRSYAAAIDSLSEELEMYRQVGHSSDEASTLKKLGLAQRDLGRPGEARDSWAGALRLLDEIGATDITEVGRDELKDLLVGLGQTGPGVREQSGGPRR